MNTNKSFSWQKNASPQEVQNADFTIIIRLTDDVHIILPGNAWKTIIMVDCDPLVMLALQYKRTKHWI